MALIPWREQFISVANGTVDMTTSRTTPTMQRDIYELSSMHPMDFTIPYFYSGLVFYGLPEFVDCADRGDTLIGICRSLKVCVEPSTVQYDFVERQLGGSDRFDDIVGGATGANQLGDLIKGTCNVVAGGPLTVLADIDIGVNISKFVFSNQFYDRDPLAVTTRSVSESSGKTEESPVLFGDMVNWILKALVVADAMNITSSNADDFPTTSVFGANYSNIFRDAIAAVGNYGDVYNRAYGTKIPRNPNGVNGIHTTSSHGGLLYPKPFGKIDIDIEAEGIDNSELEPISGSTMDGIKQRGTLHCGIITGDHHHPGLVEWNETVNDWMGMDVDFCYGIASAMFTVVDARDSLVLVPYDTLEDGFVGWADNEIDILAGATYNIVNDIKEPTTGKGFSFGDVYYYHEVENEEDDEVYTSIDLSVSVSTIAMATRQDDVQWTDFVRSMVAATIHAEDMGITKTTAGDMPLMVLFGPDYYQCLRDVILAIGNYAEIYKRNIETYIAREQNSRNLLHSGGNPMFFANWRF